MGQRLLNKEIDDRLIVKLDKTIKKQGVNGIMTFGENNDYPQIIEKLINSSSTAKAAVNIYSKFLTGSGFVNSGINNIVIGKDARGKEITILSLLRQTAISCAKHNGFYWHLNLNRLAEIGTVHMKPFKDCRFSKSDDKNYSAKIVVYDNWTKEVNYKKYDKNAPIEFSVFNLNPTVLAEQFKDTKFNGQVYFQFLDNDYFYPLSPFDSAFLDLDTEYQISLYKNRQLRNGFFKKTVVRTQPAGTDEEKKEFKEALKKQLGADGETFILLEDDFQNDGTGQISEGGFKFDTIESNIDDKLFTNWEKSIPNSIRKAIKGIPAVLIDYEENRLGNTSGEAITQATNFYNAITKDDRALIANSFKEVFSHSKIPELKNNSVWEISPLVLFEAPAISNEITLEKLKAQSNLKGSVGGVTALIALKQSVSDGLTDVGSAVEIAKEIYGFPEDIAIKIIGNPIKNGNNNNPATAGN